MVSLDIFINEKGSDWFLNRNQSVFCKISRFL